jgi:hypothetical protein
LTLMTTLSRLRPASFADQHHLVVAHAVEIAGIEEADAGTQSGVIAEMPAAVGRP